MLDARLIIGYTKKTGKTEDEIYNERRMAGKILEV